MRARCFIVALFLFTASHGGAAGIRLVCVTDDGALPLARAELGQLELAGELASVIPPPHAHWRLDGNFRGHPGLARWGAEYAVSRNDGPDRERKRDPAGPWVVAVTLRDGARSWPDPKKIRDPSLRRGALDAMRTDNALRIDWPTFAEHPGVLVVAWLPPTGDPRVLGIRPTPGSHEEPWHTEIRSELASDERSGQPLVFWWSDGGLVAPEPLFDRPDVQRQFLAIVAGETFDLTKRPEVRARSREGLSLLHYAVRSGNANAVERLLAAQADIDAAASDSDGKWTTTPLAFAIAGARQAMAEQLLDRGALPARHARDALNLALKHDHEPLLALLLRRFPNELLADTKERKETLDRIGQEGRPGLARIITDVAQEHGFEPPASNPSPDSTDSQFDRRHLPGPGFEAAWRGQTARVAELLSSRPEFATERFEGHHPHIEAARAGHADVLTLLLDAGAPIDAANTLGETAMLAAAANDHADMVTLLAERGANLGLVEGSRDTPLHAAATSGALAIVRHLLALGANPNSRNAFQATPLDLALLGGNGTVARLLLDHGAKFTPEATQAREMVQQAIINDLSAPVAAALAAGWPAQSTFATTWPAARVAQAHGATECLRLLWEQGAPAEMEDSFPVAGPGRLDEPLRLTHLVTPRDPRDPRKWFPEHAVEIRCVVDANGRVLFPRVVTTEDPRLTPAALTAASTCRFAPPVRDGKPTSAIGSFVIRFPESSRRAFGEADGATPAREMGFLEVRAPYGELPPKGVKVAVDIFVDPDGVAREISIIDSAGETFSASALLGLAQGKFRPATYRGVSVRGRLRTFISYGPVY